MRLDKKLQQLYPKISRSQLSKLISAGRVMVNGKTVLKVSRNVLDEDTLTCDENEKDSEESALDSVERAKKVKSLNQKLDILYECDDYLVINKQKGVSVHPAENTPKEEITIVDMALLHCDGKLSSVSDNNTRPGIVHRLDKDTTGILIIAKNNIFHAHLAKQIEERKVEKKYRALVLGQPQDGYINAPIYRSVKDRKKMAVRAGGKESQTEFKLLKYYPEYNISLLDVSLITGRTHQIRVHFSAIGHSVVGDVVYGNRKINERFKKDFGVLSQLLHAYEYSFTDLEGENKHFIASVPSLFNSIDSQARVDTIEAN
jgi:23S rRNA pseudouridine1911/1915/1917 synthase